MDIVEAFNEIMNESRREEKAIKSAMRVLLCHMLKCKYQNNYSTKISWRTSIKNSYRDIIDEFKDIGKGSLYKKFYMRDFNLELAYQLGRDDAIEETGLPESIFPEKCPWTREQLVDRQFIKDFVNQYGQDVV